MAHGWVGAGGAGALRLHSHDVAIRIKPLSISQKNSVVWVEENYCRARTLSIFHSNQIMSHQHAFPQITSATWLCPNGGVYTPRHGTQHPPRPNIPPHSPPPFSSPCTSPELQPSRSLSSSTSNPRRYEKLSVLSRSSQIRVRKQRF